MYFLTEPPIQPSVNQLSFIVTFTHEVLHFKNTQLLPTLNLYANGKHSLMLRSTSISPSTINTPEDVRINLPVAQHQ